LAVIAFDEETKFGYSVTGLIHPKKVLANKGAQPGDHLLFSKALGTGVISTAIKKGTAHPEWIDAAVRSMTTLNKAAAEVITNHVGTAAPRRSAEQSSAASLEHTKSQHKPGPTAEAAVATWDVHALTDVTGFGLIGHAREMARASDVSLKIHTSRVPILPGALECVRANYIPGGLKANREFAECVVSYDRLIPDDVKTLLFDPQTAGGLLIAVAAEHAADLLQALQSAGVPASDIGEVLPPGKPLIAIES
jgi:selenide,water dikinase